MASTTAVNGTGTPTTTGASWTAPANATGPNDGLYAAFTTKVDLEVGTITVALPAISLPSGSTVNSVAVTVWHHVAATARWASMGVELLSGTTVVGPLTSHTLTTTATNSQTTTYTGITKAHVDAGLSVRPQAKKSGTTSSTYNVDAVSVVVNYTEPLAASPADSFSPADQFTARLSAARTVGETLAPTDDVTAAAVGAVLTATTTDVAPPLDAVATAFTGRVLTAAGSPLTITGLSPSTDYRVRVRSVNADGVSAWTEYVPFTTTAGA